MVLQRSLRIITEDLRSQGWIKALRNLGPVFLVGGCVRDAFRNEPIKDIDMVVEDTTMERIKDVLIDFGEVGIFGESFAVIKFRPKGFKGEPFDIAVPRMDRKIGEGHKGFEIVTKGVDILGDLERRDFTVNAIAVNVMTGDLLDPFKGLDDLELGLLRAVDNTAFTEDPLRILRGIQFAARFGFKIEQETMLMMQNHADEVEDISGERIFDEFMKIITKQGDTQIAADLLFETDVDRALFGKKMVEPLRGGWEHLDAISFFFLLGICGDVDPGDFVKKRLKGGNTLENNVRTLDDIFNKLPFVSTDEEELKLMLFKAFNKAPGVMETAFLPDPAPSIVLLMRLCAIPMSEGDIQITGDDIKRIGNLEQGPEIGRIKEQILRDALMNRFDWKEKEPALEHLKNLIWKD